MRYYLLSPHIYLEFFDEDAVMLVADRDLVITVNQVAAKIFIQARETIGSDLFSRSDCIRFLLQHYELTESDAEKKMRSIIGFGLMHYMILTKRSV